MVAWERSHQSVGGGMWEYAHADEKLEIVSVGRDEWGEHRGGGMADGSCMVWWDRRRS